MPKVSVIIPSYNHAAYLSEAVGSVLSQSEADLELIVIDDGSEDNSLDVLAKFRDPRMRVVSQQNQGAHATINRGLSQATGRYLSILNSDDVYDQTRLAKMTAVLDGSPQVGLASSYIEVIDSQSRPLGVKEGYRNLEPWPLEVPGRSFRAGSDLRAALLTENYLATTSNFVFARDWWQQAGPFRGLRYAHDWDFALRMSRLAELTLIPEPLLRYRVHNTNTIRENQAAMILEICWCLAVHLPQQDLSGADGSLSPVWVDRLLYSIYTYRCERVLSVMLLQRLSERPAVAEQLLDPADLTRASYLAFIGRCIEARQSTDASTTPTCEGRQALRVIVSRARSLAYQTRRKIKR